MGGTYPINGKPQNFPVRFGIVFGKCSGDLEAVIRSVDPNAKPEHFGEGAVVYHFACYSNANGGGGNRLLKAIAVDYRQIRQRNGSFDVGVSVTSESFTLLQEVVARLVKEARIEVVQALPEQLNSYLAGTDPPSGGASRYNAFLN